ncbi:N-formylglutamate amidohydrolase [Acanthopleuribacter pedis]|uniref:N-formylglutamate amidohydrolase n=1 Tax=Acanthopleuribacter pedis TaxID=442870 RepID=A0A8J7U7E1_9BACT|nr:N-formylglutamate amidohydrolase [Acanthopleuribacter pedis]MBO1322904.1 N-formylglutamate amidohydrolase [Acanthopleuribacter pedis]
MGLPVLLSIPHGGTRVPDWLRPKLCLSEAAMFSDGDPFTREIYDLGDAVEAVVAADVVRSVLDLNRAADDLPPQNPDGVVKSHTCQGIQVYREPLDEQQISDLIHSVYRPYHDRIARLLQTPGLQLGLDCHSMLPEGPPIGPDLGKARPDICLSDGRGLACAPEMTERFARCLRQAFQLPDTAVTVNQPFSGGTITRTYGGKPIPWLQVELNRRLYLEEPPFGDDGPRVRPGAIAKLNRCFHQALLLMFGN